MQNTIKQFNYYFNRIPSRTMNLFGDSLVKEFSKISDNAQYTEQQKSEKKVEVVEYLNAYLEKHAREIWGDYRGCDNNDDYDSYISDEEEEEM